MNFVCERSTFNKALNIVSKAVSNRTTIPILKGIMIEASADGTIVFSASDQSISIRHTIQAEVREAGSVVVIAKMFTDMIRKLSGNEVEINCDDNYKVTIRSMNTKFNLNGISIDEFPIINDIHENTESIEFDAYTVKEMIDKTAFAACIDESRGAMSGVLLEIEPSQINMIAIDGFRMAINRRPMANIAEHSFVISAKVITSLSKIISDLDDNETGTLFLSEKKAIFKFSDIQVEMKLLEGKFIEYKNLISSNKQGLVMIADRQNLINSIDRASVVAATRNNNLVKFHIMDNILNISSESTEGNASEDMIVETEGSELLIGFNSVYLTNALKVIDDEMVKMVFNSNIEPCLVKPLEGNEFEHLILPVRI